MQRAGGAGPAPRLPPPSTHLRRLLPPAPLALQVTLCVPFNVVIQPGGAYELIVEGEQAVQNAITGVASGPVVLNFGMCSAVLGAGWRLWEHAAERACARQRYCSSQQVRYSAVPRLLAGAGAGLLEHQVPRQTGCTVFFSPAGTVSGNTLYLESGSFTTNQAIQVWARAGPCVPLRGHIR